MLEELHVRNFALIDEITVKFTKGLNVLTGETGAGKSLIIDAVNLLLGGRASADFIRTGADKAIIEGVFSVSEGDSLVEELERLGYPLEGETTLILTREITVSGKNICRINGRTAPLGVFRPVGNCLLQLHGQHDQQLLLDTSKQLELLDIYCGSSVSSLLKEMFQVYKELAGTKEKQRHFKDRMQEGIKNKELFEFQIKEIDQANLSSAEEENLIQEQQILVNAEKLSLIAEHSYSLLFVGGPKHRAAYDLLSEGLKELKEGVSLDPVLANIYHEVESSLFQLEEACRSLQTYKENIEFDPERLHLVEERLNQIRDLKWKYRQEIDGILAYREQAAEMLSQITDYEEEWAKISQKIAQLEEQAAEVAGILSTKRRSAAERLEEEIVRELKSLGMGHVNFKIVFRDSQLSERGKDEIEFYISPNLGEELRPLHKIASGGEMSRIMLALKVILFQEEGQASLIFDEIDAGIGGRTLTVVAEKLRELADHNQVLCVTHAPQIAGLADTHFLISKEVIRERTVTVVKVLDREERLEELTRMLGGTSNTLTTRKHATELLKT